MDDHDIIDRVRAIGITFYDVTEHYDGRIEIDLVDEGAFVLQFSHLEALAEAFGTKSINIEGSAGSAGYSEHTPGGPGSCSIVIRDRTR